MTHWQPQAIIFDMDGLLVDSEKVWHIAESEIIESRGHEYTADVRTAILGLRVDEFMTVLHDHYGLPETVEALCNELNARMLTLIPEMVKPHSGANELVAWVQQQGLPTAIASSSPLAMIDSVVELMGWGEVFKVRCTAEDEARGKPAPDVYLAAARALGVPPADCLALEDSPNGARSAVGAGMVCYAVPDPNFAKKEAFEGITPYVFDSLNVVLDDLR
ncbi:MAG: HAD-IA family hydrolase [Anaerolineae bacterium]|nr:HAD-IA family hydrolase [Anaerolineae bacterium]